MLPTRQSASAHVVVADPSPLQRYGLTRLLTAAEPPCTVTEVADGAALLRYLAATPPDVVLLSADLPHPDLSLPAFVQRLRRHHPHQRVVVLYANQAADHLIGLVRANVDGLLSRFTAPDDLCRTIATVYGGEVAYDAGALRALRRGLDVPPAPGAHSFSEREVDILRLMLQDHTRKQIARQLYISARTVDYHRRKMHEKAQTHSPIGLLLFALRHGLLDL